MIELHQYRWFKISPVDAWFFRDGRPSNRGEDQSDLESEFPPNPSTIVGALRAALARQNGWSGRKTWADNARLKSILGDGFDDLGQLSFLGPLLMEDQDVLWTMPRHVLGRNTIGRFLPGGLLQPSDEPVLCDAGEVRLPTWNKPNGVAGENKSEREIPQPPSGVFVTSKGMSRILSGQLPDADDCRDSNELFKHESRVGILREVDTRTTGPKAMYSPRYVRLRPGVSLAVGIIGLPNDWQIPPLFPLGGESRMAGVEPMSQKPIFPSGSTSGKYRLAISATAALFSDPWWGVGPNDDAGKLSPDLVGRVATVALDRQQRIGGWNSLAGGPLPLPLRPFVPPGTVWWIESTQAAQPNQLQLGQSTAYGYGLTLLSGQKGA